METKILETRIVSGPILGCLQSVLWADRPERIFYLNGQSISLEKAKAWASAYLHFFVEGPAMCGQINAGEAQERASEIRRVLGEVGA